MERLREAIQERRRHATLHEVAGQSGIPFQSVARLEAGAEPNFRTFIKLMRWLSVPRELWAEYIDEPKRKAR